MSVGDQVSHDFSDGESGLREIALVVAINGEEATIRLFSMMGGLGNKEKKTLVKRLKYMGRPYNITKGMVE